MLPPIERRFDDNPRIIRRYPTIKSSSRTRRFGDLTRPSLETILYCKIQHFASRLSPKMSRSAAPVTNLLPGESIPLRIYYLTNRLLYESITLRICYFSDVLLDGTSTLLICYCTDLFLYESITLRIYSFTNLLPYESVTLVMCYLTELVLY